jgi:hypothetical protein
MSADLFNQRTATEQIECICLRLFDSWCETRNTTSLAFLLHCWPLVSIEPSSLKQLSETLGELRKSHGTAVSDDQSRLLIELDERIEDMRLYGPASHDNGRDRAWATSKLLQLCRIEP